MNYIKNKQKYPGKSCTYSFVQTLEWTPLKTEKHKTFSQVKKEVNTNHKNKLIKNDKINRSGNQKFEKGDIFMIQ